MVTGGVRRGVVLCGAIMMASFLPRATTAAQGRGDDDAPIYGCWRNVTVELVSVAGGERFPARLVACFDGGGGLELTAAGGHGYGDALDWRFLPDARISLNDERCGFVMGPGPNRFALLACSRAGEWVRLGE